MDITELRALVDSRRKRDESLVSLTIEDATALLDMAASAPRRGVWYALDGVAEPLDKDYVEWQTTRSVKLSD